MSYPENKKARTQFSLIPSLENRWSPRSFSAKPVEKEKIQQIFEAARWAASSYNEQPWRYVVGIQGDQGSYKKVLSCLNEFNQMWAKTAPVLAISFAKKHFQDDKEKVNSHAWHDVGAASAQLTMQATELGLFVHQMAGIEYEKIREVYQLPENIEPVAALAIGYLGEPDQLPENLQESEKSDRSRKPLSDLVFGKNFGASLESLTQ